MRVIKALVLGCLAVSINTEAADNTTVSYAMGYKTGQALKTQAVAVDTSAFANGLSTGYSGQKPLFSEQIMQSSLKDMQKQMTEKLQQQYQKNAENNKKEGEAFLANNAKMPNIKTLPSGLQYQIVKAGDGESPTLNDMVTVNYEGKLINGKVFDSSYERGKPVTFKVSDVISGWQEALLMMQPGATWMLYIPSDLAYGKQGSMGTIGPNEVLIFKVALLSVKPA